MTQGKKRAARLGSAARKAGSHLRLPRRSFRRCEVARMEEDERFVLAREARQRDENRIRRFEESQRRKSKWIKVAEIAEWFSELGGSGPNEAALENAYTIIERDILAGRFEEGGRSQVLFL